MSLATLLVLADGRLPTGGHAHSGGLEEAVVTAAVRTTDDLASWLAGRLATVGRVEAAFAAAAWTVAASAGADGRPPAGWGELVDEHSARIPSPAQRSAAHTQGRGLLRAARRCWAAPLLEMLADHPGGAPWAVVLGAASRAAGLSVAEATLVASHAAVSGPAWSATRLLSMDPFAVASTLAALAPAVAREAADAERWASAPCADIPSSTAALLEIGAQRHAGWEVRLFAS